MSHFTFLFLSVSSILFSCEGWFRFSNGHFAPSWQPMRRSIQCYTSNGECLETSQCCSPNDVCLMDRHQSAITGRTIGRCHDIDQYKGMIKDLKMEGESCKDSYECGKGLCCRAILRYRYGIVHRCGKSEGPYMCISHSDLHPDSYDLL